MIGLIKMSMLQIHKTIFCDFSVSEFIMYIC